MKNKEKSEISASKESRKNANFVSSKLKSQFIFKLLN